MPNRTFAVALAPNDARGLADTEILGARQPEGRDLLVEVRATSVNPTDLAVRAGRMKGPTSGVLGFDAAGVVRQAAGHTTLFKPGDPVYYAGQVDRSGSFSSLQLVDERIVGHKPRTISYAEAASVPLTGLTAWEGLFDKLRLQPTTQGTLLVVGAGGGVGSMVIQLAKALTDVRVVATASHAESAKWAAELGADAVVDHSSPDLEDEIRWAAPAGVDYVFATHAAPHISVLAAVMNPFGHIVAVGDEEQVDLHALRPKSLSWHWEQIFARSVYRSVDMISQHRILDSLAQLIDSRVIRPTARTYLSPVNAAAVDLAHRRLASGHSVGKTVLVRGDVDRDGLLPRGAVVEEISPDAAQR